MSKRRIEPDFCGWATVYGKLCGDGRIIKHGAFDDMDGMEVPLVYQHNHNDVEQLIGKVILHSQPERGMYCDGFFNESAKADCARDAVAHGDIQSLSIWANDLTENSRHEVSHGTIREVSLVLSGANPDARIDYVSLSHGAGPSYDEAIIYNGVLFDYGLQHGDEDDGEDYEDEDEDYEDEEEDYEDEDEDEDWDDEEEDDEDEDEYDEDEDEDTDVEPVIFDESDVEELISVYSGLDSEDQEIFNDALACIGGEDLTEDEFDAIIDMLDRQDDDTQDALIALLAVAGVATDNA